MILHALTVHTHARTHNRGSERLMRAARRLHRPSDPNQYAIDQGRGWLAGLNLCQFGQAGQKSTGPHGNSQTSKHLRRLLFCHFISHKFKKWMCQKRQSKADGFPFNAFKIKALFAATERKNQNNCTSATLCGRKDTLTQLCRSIYSQAPYFQIFEIDLFVFFLFSFWIFRSSGNFILSGITMDNLWHGILLITKEECCNNN